MKHRESRRLTALIVGLMVLSGACTTATTTKTSKGYMQLCQDYVGKEVERVVEQWGYPDRTLKETVEGKVYVYQKIIDPFGLDKLDYTPLIEYPPFIKYPEISGEVIGGYLRGQNCLTYFETDPNDRVVKIVWKGDCTAEERE